MARLQVWGASLKMALDHPFGVGAGNFSAAYGRFYRPGAEDSMIAWAQGRWLSAHSVYFRVLGEYGFIGLLMILAILFANVRQNFRTRAAIRAAGGVDGVPESLPGIINMSLVGYAVAGTFLGGLTYPYLYILSGLTVGTARRVAVAESVSAAATAPAPPSAGRRQPTPWAMPVARRPRPAAAASNR